MKVPAVWLLAACLLAVAGSFLLCNQLWRRFRLRVRMWAALVRFTNPQLIRANIVYMCVHITCAVTVHRARLASSGLLPQESKRTLKLEVCLEDICIRAGTSPTAARRLVFVPPHPSQTPQTPAGAPIASAPAKNVAAWVSHTCLQYE